MMMTGRRGGQEIFKLKRWPRNRESVFADWCMLPVRPAVLCSLEPDGGKNMRVHCATHKSVSARVQGGRRLNVASGVSLKTHELNCPTDRADCPESALAGADP